MFFFFFFFLREIKTNLENRLNNQAEITLSTFLDLGLQDHTL